MKRLENYVDGFVLPVPLKNLAAYKKEALKAKKVWLESGALDYVECMADDVPEGKSTSFSRSVKLKKGEVVFFSWATYKNRKHRDQVMKKVMADPRMTDYDPKKMPFDGKRMFWGGFKMVVKS